MSFQEAIQLQPQWVQIWVLWLVVISFAWIPLLFSKATRRIGLIVLLVNTAVTISMNWLYAEVGYVRLLGLPHLILWGPLAVYLWLQIRRRDDIPRALYWLIVVLAASITVSLAFDTVDVIRYLIGERAPLIPDGA
jgi:hypothetical protein